MGAPRRLRRAWRDTRQAVAREIEEEDRPENRSIKARRRLLGPESATQEATPKHRIPHEITGGTEKTTEEAKEVKYFLLAHLPKHRLRPQKDNRRGEKNEIPDNQNMD